MNSGIIYWKVIIPRSPVSNPDFYPPNCLPFRTTPALWDQEMHPSALLGGADVSEKSHRNESRERKQGSRKTGAIIKMK